MNKVLLLFGISLFIIGSVLFLGAYFVFNRYSTSGSNVIGINIFSTNTEWQFPKMPFELAKGDQIIVSISLIGGAPDAIADLYLAGTSGNTYSMGQGGNSTFYYYVQTNDLYYCRMEIPDTSFNQTGSFTWSKITATMNIEVVSNNPNMFFLLIGVIVLLAGAVSIPVAFLYRSKNESRASSFNSSNLLEASQLSS
jgi:hypothetical protein